MTWPHWLEPIAVGLGYRAALQAVAEVRAAMVAGRVTYEEDITGSLAVELAHRLRAARGGGHSFEATVYQRRSRNVMQHEEEHYGADLQLVLVSHDGVKSLLLQAKRGDRIGSGWSDLVDKCTMMRGFAAGRAVVYYRDEFVSADAGKIARGVAFPPREGAEIGDLPNHWRTLPMVIRDILRCWVGSFGPPPVLTTAIVLMITHFDGAHVDSPDLRARARSLIPDGYVEVDEGRWNSDRAPDGHLDQ